MDTVNDRPGLVIASTSEVAEMENNAALEELEITNAVDSVQFTSSLGSHITTVFQENKEARVNSGVEEKMFQSLRAYNGHYDPSDLAAIRATSGSEIYMNITPAKCRVTMAWLRDIFLAAGHNSYSIDPTPIPSLPAELMAEVEEKINKMASAAPQKPQAEQSQSMAATQNMSETNKLKADIEEAIRDEIYKVAKAELQKFEDLIADQLTEGGWDDALSEFIEDFCVFQVAIMKAPVISKKKKIVWETGLPVPIEDYCYLNKRVSPLDIYPSASATHITDGDLCEHMRLTRKDLYNLIGVPDYKEEAIRRILQEGATSSYAWLDTNIEEEKTTEEYRGDSYRANKGIHHAIHFYGSVPYDTLEQFGLTEAEIGTDIDAEVEVEAILVGHEVIKCVINDDPLLRRPYYKASFQKIPGSWWGRSLPELIRDIQRMCNAAARSLANNMGISSGPQIEVYTDRLAADEEIDSIYPFKIWQLISDGGGGSGRAIQFWQPQSNAQELLAVYKEFEQKADDATGVPSYMQGQPQNGALTASSLAMLMESSSKGIKDAARHIDVGLIKPRVEYQFYWNIITDPDADFTGDVQIKCLGSQALTMKGSQEMRRNEFLTILSNPSYQQIVGVEGVAEILREMASSLGLGENIIPSKVELRKKQADQEAQQAEAQKMEAERAQQSDSVGIQQVQMQTQQAESASQRNAEIKMADLQAKAEQKEKELQVKILDLQSRIEAADKKHQVDLQKQQMVNSSKEISDNKNIALSIKSGFQDKSNIE